MLIQEPKGIDNVLKSVRAKGRDARADRAADGRRDSRGGMRAAHSTGQEADRRSQGASGGGGCVVVGAVTVRAASQAAWSRPSGCGGCGRGVAEAERGARIGRRGGGGTA